MTDFTTIDETKATDFADRVGWEVIVQNERLRLSSAGQRIQILRIAVGTQCYTDQSLCLSTFENGRSVYLFRQHIHIASQFADFFDLTAIQTLRFIQYGIATNLFLQGFESNCDTGFGVIFALKQTGFHRFCNRILLYLAHGFVGRSTARIEPGFTNGFRKMFFAEAQNFRFCNMSDVRQFLRVDLACQGFLCIQNRLYRFLSEMQSFNETIFRQLIRATFDHQSIGTISDVNQIQIGFELLIVIGVYNKLAIDFSDANASDGAIPRNIGAEQCCGCTVDHQNIRLIL